MIYTHSNIPQRHVAKEYYICHYNMYRVFKKVDSLKLF